MDWVRHREVPWHHENVCIKIYIHTHTQGYVVLDGFEFRVEAVREASFVIGVVGSYGSKRVVAGPLRTCFVISFRVFFV